MITPAQMAVYRRTAAERQAAERRALLEWRERALALAHEAAAVLRQQFGAEQVFLFGSLTCEVGEVMPVHAHSDVDLAAWGIAENEYLRAVACLLDLGGEIDIDLVRLEEATPQMQETIAGQGVLL